MTMNDNGLESRLRDYGQLLDEAASDHEPAARPIAAPRRIERRALVLAGTAAALVAAALGINGVVGSKDSGREVQVSSGGGAGPRQQTDCPAPTGERIRAVARTGERLRVETLPDGFTLTSGDETDPAGGAELTYGKRDDPAGPRVQLSRRLSSQPAEQFISGEGKSPQQIRGHSGAISGGGPGSQFTTAAWNETPDIVITLTGYRLGRAKTLQVADGVHYEPGAAGETVAVMPSEAPTECRTLPPQTLSRRDVADRFPGAQTKLVRLSQITQSPQFAGLCSSATCTEGLVVWAALRQGPPGSFPHSCPPGAPPEACSGSWQLVIIDAAGRASGYGTNIGNGPPPPEFTAWEDLAP
jgi:hypothetical protein